MSAGGLFSLNGRVALVAGASRGIGAAIVGTLAEAGASVFLGGRSLDRLEPEAARLRAAGSLAEAITLDVTDGPSVDAAVRSIGASAGRIDILVNAAGVSPIYKRAERIELAEWDAIVATNLTGTFRMCLTVGRLMLERRSGSIINIISVGAAVGLPRLAAYTASKAGVLGLSRTLALEWADRGIRVNAIAPSFVHTDMTAGLLEHERFGPEIVASTPLGRFGEPQDIAGAALYLASDAAGFVTGTTLFVDGGWSAR